MCVCTRYRIARERFRASLFPFAKIFFFPRYIFIDRRDSQLETFLFLSLVDHASFFSFFVDFQPTTQRCDGDDDDDDNDDGGGGDVMSLTSISHSEH